MFNKRYPGAISKFWLSHMPFRNKLVSSQQKFFNDLIHFKLIISNMIKIKYDQLMEYYLMEFWYLIGPIIRLLLDFWWTQIFSHHQEYMQLESNPQPFSSETKTQLFSQTGQMIELLWLVICTVHLTVCSYHVTYAFQSESILYYCLNVKELLARSRHEIWSLIECNWTQT